MEQKKTLFEQLVGTYHEERGYIIPDLRLPEEKERTIGLFGQRYLQYLREYRKVTYINLLTSGKLNAYLAEIDRQAAGCNARCFPFLKKFKFHQLLLFGQPSIIYTEF